MEKNVKITIQYDGSRYQGWQKLGDSTNTIQGKFEAILEKMAGHPISIQASGRTDAGVHAHGQVANFILDSSMSMEEIKDYLNQYLPDDIAVIKIEEVSRRFHSRLSAIAKTYRYTVRNSKIPDVFQRKYMFRVENKIDVKAMQKASEYLTGEHDFKAFTSLKKIKKSTIRTIYEVKIEQQQDDIIFTYTGNGFLHHMVRILTGTLLEIGKGNRQPEEISEIMMSGNRENAGPLVPAQGLSLMEVNY